MTITFLTVGKPSKGWVAEAVSHYTRFLSKYAHVSLDHVKSVSAASRSGKQLQELESERLLQKLQSIRSAAVVVCDRNGRMQTSGDFAQSIQELIETHGGHAIVVIGGAFGVTQTVLKSADHLWSFGRLTLPHDLALVTAMEQVARAFSILRGEPYHK